jgi:hypothetical protein
MWQRLEAISSTIIAIMSIPLYFAVWPGQELDDEKQFPGDVPSSWDVLEWVAL